MAALVVVVALVVAIWPRGGDESPSGQGGESRTSATPAAADPELAGTLAPCPAPTAGSGPLAGVTLDCLRDGAGADLGSVLGGKPALVNLWAYWCAPCAQELPVLQDFAGRANGAVTVLTVHSDPDRAKAVARLADLSITTLPGYQDGDGRVAKTVSAPPVLPVSVLVRADGSVAKVLAHPFTSVDEVADEVRATLGVAA